MPVCIIRTFTVVQTMASTSAATLTATGSLPLTKP